MMHNPTKTQFAQICASPKLIMMTNPRVDNIAILWTPSGKYTYPPCAMYVERRVAKYLGVPASAVHCAEQWDPINDPVAGEGAQWTSAHVCSHFAARYVYRLAKQIAYQINCDNPGGVKRQPRDNRPCQIWKACKPFWARFVLDADLASMFATILNTEIKYADAPKPKKAKAHTPKSKKAKAKSPQK